MNVLVGKLVQLAFQFLPGWKGRLGGAVLVLGGAAQFAGAIAEQVGILPVGTAPCGANLESGSLLVGNGLGVLGLTHKGEKVLQATKDTQEAVKTVNTPGAASGDTKPPV